MTRAFTASLALVFVAGLIGFDLANARPNPYKAPPAFALGSGAVPTGGFCGALPD